MNDKLYDVVAENYKNAGLEFNYRKNTYLCDVGKHPQVIDVSNYLELSNEDFAQAIFVAAYRRLPEQKECGGWIEKYGWDRAEFQKDVLQHIVKVPVVAINHIRFINNPYFEQKMGFKYHAYGILYGLTNKSFLRELGKKLPQPIQKIVRKVFL